MRRIWVVFAGVLAACGGTAGGGDACSADTDCAAGLACFGAPGLPQLVNGYCSADCSNSDCPDGLVCTPVADRSLCLKACSAPSDCRDSYQCFQGACNVACDDTANPCPMGYQCQSGTCTPYDGAVDGATRQTATDCSSRLCQGGICTRQCTRDSGCMGGMTCRLDLNSTSAAAKAICATPGGAGAATAVCTADTDCARGSCQLGVCVELCVGTGDCHGSSLRCDQMLAPLDSGDAAPFTGCLPTTGMISFDVPMDGQIPLPETAQAMALFTYVPGYTVTTLVGITELDDPSGTAIYTQPADENAFYAEAIRYIVSEGSSTMLVPNAPTPTLMPGIYTPTVSSSPINFNEALRVYVKLGPAPPSTGSVVLNLYVTDLSGACAQAKNITAANAATQLATAITELKNIYSQVGITVTAVNVKSTTAANVVVAAAESGTNTDLDAVLSTATAGSNTPGMDVVLLRAITDANGMNNGVLGIAGGIPGSPMLGTPHSGAVVSMQTLCSLGQAVLGSTMAHEVGHTLGLFHNGESDGHGDALSDTSPTDTTNVMFWEENGGTNLSAMQGQVVRDDPKVTQ